MCASYSAGGSGRGGGSSRGGGNSRGGGGQNLSGESYGKRKYGGRGGRGGRGRGDKQRESESEGGNPDRPPPGLRGREIGKVLH